MCYSMIVSSGTCRRNWKATKCVGERNVRRTNEGPRTECLDAAPSGELVLHNPVEHAEEMPGKEMINSFQAFSFIGASISLHNHSSASFLRKSGQMPEYSQNLHSLHDHLYDIVTKACVQ